jgi:uncharacterized membrane protein YkoI
MTTWLRKVHVVMTALVGAQLVVWTATGFAFTLFDFGAVRGTADRAPAPAVDLDGLRVTPGDAARLAASGASGARARSVALIPVDGRTTYVVAFAGGHDEVLVDATNGIVKRVDDDVASRIAVSAFHGDVHVRDVERRRSDDRDGFVVHLDDRRDTLVTVDAHTGEVTAWKNRPYRLFDALFSAHVLGYVDGTSPANWPLRVLGFLALAAAASGAGLLLGRFREFARARFSARSVASVLPTGSP